MRLKVKVHYEAMFQVEKSESDDDSESVYESESANKGIFQVEEGLLERAILHLADSLHPHHFLLSQVTLEYQTIGETCKKLPKVKLNIF